VSRPRRRSDLALAGTDAGGTKSGDPGRAGSGLIADSWGRIGSVTADEEDVDAAVADEEDEEEEDNTNAAADEEEDEEEENVDVAAGKEEEDDVDGSADEEEEEDSTIPISESGPGTTLSATALRNVCTAREVILTCNDCTRAAALRATNKSAISAGTALAGLRTAVQLGKGTGDEAAGS